MKLFDYIIAILLAILCFVLWNNNKIEDSRITKQTKVYNQVVKFNDKKINNLKKENKILYNDIDSLNKYLKLVEEKEGKHISKINNLEKLLKLKPRWKIKTVEKIKFITLPVKDLQLKLDKINIFEKLVPKLNLSITNYREMLRREKESHNECKNLLKMYQKRKKRKFALSIGGMFTNKGIGYGVSFGYIIKEF